MLSYTATDKIDCTVLSVHVVVLQGPITNQVFFQMKSKEKLLRYEHRQIFMSSDATHNLLQNQPLIAILMTEFFFSTYLVNLGRILPSKNRIFPAKLVRIQLVVFFDLEQELRNENKSLLELFTTHAQQKYPLATDDKKNCPGWGGVSKKLFSWETEH